MVNYGLCIPPVLYAVIDLLGEALAVEVVQQVQRELDIAELDTRVA